MTSEYVVVENPYPEFDIVGTQLSNNRLAIYSQPGATLYDLRGQELERWDNSTGLQVIGEPVSLGTRSGVFELRPWCRIRKLKSTGGLFIGL